MAYQPYAGDGGFPVYGQVNHEAPETYGKGLGTFTNFAAAAVSLGLMAGVAVWGYKLMVRDVSGIPVVRAVAGEMRVLPDDPGGQLAQHQGLSVNSVAADGGAAAPADRLVLAPQPVALTTEDVPLDAQAVAIVQQAIADQSGSTRTAGPESTAVTIDPARIAEATETGSVDSLVAALTNGVAPLEGSVASGPEVVVQVAATGTEAARQLLANPLADKPGVKVSLRPQLRPGNGFSTRRATPAPTAVVATGVQSINPQSLPSGTRLVQLGAYDSAELALANWERFTARFGDLMAGKAKVVQQASSGGRTFYRLRAHGFEDLADARRFCSAIVAEGADCIPVVTR